MIDVFHHLITGNLFIFISYKHVLRTCFYLLIFKILLLIDHLGLILYRVIQLTYSLEAYRQRQIELLIKNFDRSMV